MQLDALEARVALGLRRHPRDVELVVDVDVEPEPRGLDRVDRLAGELERDRLVQEPGPVGPDDGRALVADQRIGQRCRLEHPARRLHHPPGDDDHAEPCSPAHGAERRACAAAAS